MSENNTSQACGRLELEIALDVGSTPTASIFYLLYYLLVDGGFVMATTTESVPTEELVTSDFTLNTFSIGLLTAQYARTGTTPAEQVPFCQGIRGPETLRRKGNGNAATDTTLETVIPELGDQHLK